MALLRVIGTGCLVLVLTTGCGDASGCSGQPDPTDTLASGQSESVQVPVREGRFGLISSRGREFTVYRWVPDPLKGSLERPARLRVKDGTYTGTVTASEGGWLVLTGVDQHRYLLVNAHPCY